MSMSRVSAAYKPRTRWLGVALVALLAWAVVVTTAGTARAADGDITVKIRVAAEQTSLAVEDISPSVGATVTLYDKDGTAVDTAVSDAEGIATFTLPAKDAGTHTALVTAAPPGFHPGPHVRWDGSFFKADLRPGGTYMSRYDLPTVRDNPVIAPTCGLKVAVVINISGSLERWTQQEKDAAKAYVNALTGTPSQIQLFTAGDNPNPVPLSDLTSVSTQASADALNAKIDTVPIEQYAKIHSTLWLVAKQPVTFDLAVMVDDGDLAFDWSGRNDPFNTVVLAANSLKAQGTRIEAAAVGNGVIGNLSADWHLEGQGKVLSALSGPTDYYQDASYDAKALSLRDLAMGTCSSGPKPAEPSTPTATPTDTPKATSTDAPAPTSTSTPAPPAAKAPLAETGSNTGLVVALVAVLLAAGGTLAVVARRRIAARR